MSRWISQLLQVDTGTPGTHPLYDPPEDFILGGATTVVPLTLRVPRGSTERDQRRSVPTHVYSTDEDLDREVLRLFNVCADHGPKYHTQDIADGLYLGDSELQRWNKRTGAIICDLSMVPLLTKTPNIKLRANVVTISPKVGSLGARRLLLVAEPEDLGFLYRRRNELRKIGLIVFARGVVAVELDRRKTFWERLFDSPV